MRRERGVVCLVTGGRGARRPPADMAREAVDAGVDIVQVRERHLEARALADLTAAIVEIARGSQTDVVVNDRLDVALACRAAGVHLRSDSFGAADVRSIAPAGFLVGRSVHGADDARAQASTLDYVIAGTVYATSSKPDGAPLLGAPGLREVVQATEVPVLAIGGITLDRLGEVASTGAAGIAGIGVFQDANLRMVQVVRSVRARFDSVQPAANIRPD